ncbi:hypothetical protein [Alistipes sp.]|uniref:hypothetical protein n=1 Tax=Alistipes sp. TaxID=1872444 RepID=UPI0025BB93F7|nr:hypothetical protein [Alistipes sp.]
MKCPKCKEELPLLSRVCPVCGYVLEDENHNASDSINRLEHLLHEMKGLPRPSFLKSMNRLSIFVLPILTLLLVIMAVVSQAGLLWILSIIFAVWTLVVIILRLAGRLGNTYSDRQFAKMKNDFELLARSANRDFGKNREVARLLEEITAQIADIETSRRNISRRHSLYWIIIAACVLAASSTVLHSIRNAAREYDAETAIQGWQDAVEKFRTSGLDDDYDAAPRTMLLKKILEAGEAVAAEDFFREFCMKRIGDYDCARQIVEYYRQNNKVQEARRFVESCQLRYKSEYKKLKKLLTD